MVNTCSKLPVQIFPKHTGSNRPLIVICRRSCPKLFWHCHSEASAVTSFLASRKLHECQKWWFILSSVPPKSLLLSCLCWHCCSCGLAWKLIQLKACLTKKNFSLLANSCYEKDQTSLRFYFSFWMCFCSWETIWSENPCTKLRCFVWSMVQCSASEKVFVHKNAKITINFKNQQGIWMTCALESAHIS